MIMLGIVIITAIWVYFDAKKIGVRKDLVTGFFNMGPGTWCFATLLLWIVVFPAYLIKRGGLKRAAIEASGGSTSSPSSSAVADRDAIANLEKLAGLRERGLLTDEEFTQKKRELLGV